MTDFWQRMIDARRGKKFSLTRWLVGIKRGRHYQDHPIMLDDMPTKHSPTFEELDEIAKQCNKDWPWLRKP